MKNQKNKVVLGLRALFACLALASTLACLFIVTSCRYTFNGVLKLITNVVNNSYAPKGASAAPKHIYTHLHICIIYLQLYGVSRRIRNTTQIDLFAPLLWCKSVVAVFVIIAASHIKVSYLVLLLYCYLVASCALWWHFPCLPHY